MQEIKRYEFEGAMRTISEVTALVPALKRTAIALRLERGMTTRKEMLLFDVEAARRAGGRRGRASCGNKLYFGEKKP